MLLYGANLYPLFSFLSALSLSPALLALLGARVLVVGTFASSERRSTQSCWWCTKDLAVLVFVKVLRISNIGREPIAGAVGHRFRTVAVGRARW